MRSDMEALAYLQALGEAGWYWHAARGRLKPTEPLYGVGLYRPEDNGDRIEITGECETLRDATRDLARKLAERIKH